MLGFSNMFKLMTMDFGHGTGVFFFCCFWFFFKEVRVKVQNIFASLNLESINHF